MNVLLDEHLPKAVAATLRRLCPAVEAQHVADWQSGRWLSEEDPVLLEGLWQQRCVLVSYDRATLPGHLAERIADGKQHAGVVFVDPERFPPHRIGEMARALAKLFDAFPKEDDWFDRTVTLTR